MIYTAFIHSHNRDKFVYNYFAKESENNVNFWKTRLKFNQPCIVISCYENCSIETCLEAVNLFYATNLK